MLPTGLLRWWNEPNSTDGPPPLDSSANGQVRTSTTNERYAQESNGKSVISQVATNANPIEIVAQDRINSVAFLADGEYVVSGGREKKIRQWRAEDGEEVTQNPKGAGSVICDLAVTQDGKWIVCGTNGGQVIVWDAKSHEMMNKFEAHDKGVITLDVSADGTRIATGSNDRTLGVWSLRTGKRLLRPFEHKSWLTVVKFSPDGRFIATATFADSIRIYYGSNDEGLGSLLADFPIQVGSLYDGSLAWASDSNRLFALSRDGDIRCLDIPTQKTLAKWHIHSDNKPNCIALACNDTIIVASANSSLSLWDTKTCQQTGAVIHHPYFVRSMAISSSGTIATAGDKGIMLQNLCDILPSHYCKDILLEREIRRLKVEKHDLEEKVQFLHAQYSRQKDDIVDLEKTNQELRNQLATSNEEKTCLNQMLKSLRAQNETSNRKITRLDVSDKELCNILVASQGSIDQLTQTIKLLRADVNLPEKTSITRNITKLELFIQELGNRFTACKSVLRVYDKKHECETLYADGRVCDAAQHIPNVITEVLRDNKLLIDWLKEFKHQCVARLQESGDEALSSKKHDEALSAYSTVLSLTPSPPEGVLMGWARTVLIHCSVSEALGPIDKFKLPTFHIYRVICNVLEGDDRLLEAIECFQKMQNELSQETSTLNERQQWELDFRQRCIEKLEKVGDTEMDSKNHDAAIISYSIALSLHPVNMTDIIVKYCRVRVNSLQDELVNITQIAERGPSDYNVYKRKHAVLYSLGRYKEAFEAFEIMLPRMENSLDPQVQDMRSCYLDTTPLIRKVVEQTIRDIPHVLIDSITGRLHDRMMLMTAFEECLMFEKLRSFMITRDRFDYACIQQEVEKFYEYAMFSHRWQPPEPSFQMVENAIIYGLPASPANDKLINFCKLVRSRRFRWAWSDTCCVNQSDKGVQQESVVAMFQWYCRAALTIVHLLGVHSKSQKKGSLWKSIWNTRGWTYQEYVASRVVQFYTEDWQPYLDVKLLNHKESPLILSEMEQATKFATQDLATLQPGLTMVREKLYLASKRETTRVEDVAYSLFGIFDVAPPVVYGEGTRAVRRLLEYILNQSDNVTLLSWTRAGNSGSSTNSYLPSDLTVYDQIEPPHVPQPIDTAEMDRMIVALQSSLSDPLLAIQLYERLHHLPPLSIVTGRLHLPGFVFSLESLTAVTAEPGPDPIVHAYNATAPILGDIRIETNDDLVKMHGLVLIHPWISPLLDRDFYGGATQFSLTMRALRLVVQLKQPFGALLLASQGRVLYKRVATDSFIKVQIRADTPLEELMDSIRIVDLQ